MSPGSMCVWTVPDGIACEYEFVELLRWMAWMMGGAAIVATWQVVATRAIKSFTALRCLVECGIADCAARAVIVQYVMIEYHINGFLNCVSYPTA